MLFHSSLRKELGRSFSATLVVLATVVMTMMLIRTLGQASKGSVNPSEVMMVMGYTVLGQLPTILALSLFVAIVGTLSRMYRDSEMVIWFASGRGLASFLPVLLRFALPVLVVIGVLALLVWPWANRQVQDLRDHYEQRGDIDRVAPGQFQESANGNRVFFIDKASEADQGGNNVFVSATDHGSEAVTSARSARLTTLHGDRFVLLSNGQRLENNLEKPGMKISVFAEYATRIGTATPVEQDGNSTKYRPTLQLLRDPSNMNLAELAWRMSLALAAVNFVLLGLSITMVDPRAGRSGNLMLALFTFVVYYNFMTLGQSWIESGRIDFAIFMVLSHGGALAAAAFLLAKRHNNWSLRSLLRRHSAAPVQP
ncbi:LPS export ABC transporter permease LptF [Ramlibacter sp. H39-3-26]|uniref:LPS export ABC transporter permease LptF n=1 Tax=Curvibacter soli TaxID=3031331 RepID=UPI0023D9C75D|nr:LPS export ABC transporter permease LptF [Ramlibacter sp. H39-3-26]MDF1485667.1 LPS export ABC transporter permease LptF [Ramlibacter sp. H39-3-26]